ncbi:tRNA (uracil-5-)-methyltransferase homolog A-like isoform X2 [Daktulosphaira vitifoliae]|uniref:tRNA (uracil-5-)-methyltransferase homolog A-like isoform X2 n=1 Tax=Daktulosphaira vitifoliae TaxID=58002 RepID=UPI0021AAE832|nr:tRNA (uracil-5-)-methyltransferase homolog A-like isoform X2 [Daktulosphaira vitifoliae]
MNTENGSNILDVKPVEVKSVQQVELDPFAYLERNDFTSEKFKLEEFKKLINQQLKLNSVKVKTPTRNGKWLYVCFHSDEEKISALNVLNGYSWKNTVLEVSEAKAVPDPLVKKRNEQFENNAPDTKKPKLCNVEAEKQMIENVTPLHHLPYEEQLTQKEKCMRNILLDYNKRLPRANRGLLGWLRKQQSNTNGLPCELLKIQSLKEDVKKCVGYRNKCEFTIGMDIENKEPVVGFRIGTYVQGKTCVAPIDNVSNVPEQMKVAVKVFQNFIRKSNITVFNPETYTGHCRQLTVRLSLKTEQLMLICVVHTENMEENIVETLKKQIIDYYTEGEGKFCKVDSLFFQKAKKRVAGEGNLFPLELLKGQEYIVEEMNGLKFRISPESFFQVNTAASEILIQSVKELALINSKTTVLDICCGTGTIGLSLAKDCARVIGVEILEEAVNMAKLNAIENNIKNVQFFCGKAEEVMNRREFQYPENVDDLVAIVDPPRAGLHNKAIELLRRMKNLKRLVYISCNPKAALQNFITLAMPESKTKYGAPFIPIKAIPVDMFPQTPHCELIVYFERYTENNENNG